MGGNSRGKDGEGTSGINRVDDDDSYEYLQEMNFVPYETLLHNNMNTNGFVVPFLMQQAGTTCATVLIRAIFTEGCINMDVDAVVTNLKSRARMIDTSEEIAQVDLTQLMPAARLENFQTKNLSKEEFVQTLRLQSNVFSRGSLKYRGVTLHRCGRWEARMGQFLGSTEKNNNIHVGPGAYVICTFNVKLWQQIILTFKINCINIIKKSRSLSANSNRF
ncbi:hypothetical protein MTR_1g037030 [Medicago truncatula]|uniref:Uncharacterized protein n=1 Tax=Medicago truncatula TaxID=3880 RepID=A0A072VFX0_MEDTR|nr:hypothetical protein MTR_1g037030 [Medicago truncatula]